MNKLLKDRLIDFGLSEKEASVYLALLEHDTSNVQEIAEHAGVNRSSTYVVLESLQKKGLVTERPGQEGFVAAPPDTLLKKVEDASRETKMIREKIIDILPDLKAIHKDNRYKPGVKVFEGGEGLREVYYNIFVTKTKILKVYADPINIFDALPNFMEHNIERIKRGIKMYAINPATEANMELYRALPKEVPDEMLLIPPENFALTSDMAIYGDIVALASPREKFGLIIESKEMARAIEVNFDLAWMEALRLNKEHKLPRK